MGGKYRHENAANGISGCLDFKIFGGGGGHAPRSPLGSSRIWRSSGKPLTFCFEPATLPINDSPDFGRCLFVATEIDIIPGTSGPPLRDSDASVILNHRSYGVHSKCYFLS